MQRFVDTEQGLTLRTSKYVFDELIEEHGWCLACSQCSLSKFYIMSLFSGPRRPGLKSCVFGLLH